MGQGRETARERRERDEFTILLGRVLELPDGRQLEFHKALTDVLSRRLGAETKRAEHVRRRLEAVESVRLAAKQLGLPEGQAPSVAQFKEAARATKLPMSFATVHRVFDGRWELACRYYQGLPVPRNAAQRAVSREGGRYAPREDALLGLRMWLRELPSVAGRTQVGYRDWAVERNEHRPQGHKRVLEMTSSVSNRLQLSWPYVLAVAAEEMSLAEARTEHLNDLINGTGPLVGWEAAAYLLELPKRRTGATPLGYPNPAMLLHRKPHWLFEELRAYENGEREFKTARYSEDRFMDDEEVAKALGLNYRQMCSRLRPANPDPRRSPPPAGRSGRHNYWERATVEDWLRKERARKEERVRDRVAYQGAPSASRARKLARAQVLEEQAEGKGI
jgi:hypothetical protein